MISKDRKARRRFNRSNRAILRVETLEERTLPSVAAPDYVIHQASGTNGTSAPYTPQDVQTAYGINQITFSGNVTGNGGGQTIVLVDAYDDPNALSDLEAFDKEFGLANPPSFEKLNEYGQSTNLPGTDSSGDWEVEESLDIEWAHAIAPGANIVLVEANSASSSDLFQAVSTAATLGSVVSMSWGIQGGYSGETSQDSTFDVSGVTFLASTGDSGSPGNYPAESPDVVAVGGTSLYLGSAGSYSSETGWSGSGGGLSDYESTPSYQDGVANVVGTSRGTPDVSAVADPNTGVYVYDSFDSSNYGGDWLQVGGTSLSSPIWAGLIAIADQGRADAGLGTLSSTQTLTTLYGLPSTEFNDITSGSNGAYSAGLGYDLVTGLGSPIANLLVPGLVGDVSSQFPLTAGGSNETDSSTGSAVATDSAGNTYVTGYFTGSQVFGSTTLNAQGQDDAYVAKYSAAGNLLWVDDLGGADASVAGSAIAVSSTGNVYVTGSFSGTANFSGSGADNLTSSGAGNNAYVLELNAGGQTIGVVDLGAGSSNAEGTGITVDASGNVFTTGYFTGTGNFAGASGTQNLSSSGTGDNAYVSKLNSKGYSVFAVRLGSGAANAVGTGIALDGSGDIYTTGYFAGTGNFAGASGTDNLTSSGSGNNSYVSKLNNKGQYVFAVTLGAGSSNTEANAIAVDGVGDVYTTGFFSGTANFAGLSGTDDLTSSDGGSDTNAFVSKLTAGGKYIFGAALGAVSSDAVGTSIAVDGTGNVYSTGFFTGTGNFAGASGTDDPTSSGGSNDYVSELSSSGSYVLSSVLGAASSASGAGIAINGLGDINVIGSFTGTGNFSGSTAPADLTSAYAGANTSFYVGQLQQQAPLMLGPTTLASWTQDIKGYSQTIVAGGGAGALTLSLKSGSLPSGLKFNAATGVVSGTPTTPGIFTFEISATDADGDIALRIYAITINALTSIATNTLPSGDVGTAYDQTIAVNGGTGPFSYSLKSGNLLPAGLTLNANTGVISGIPAIAGTFNFNLVVTDSLNVSATKQYSLTMYAPPAMSTASLADWDVNLPNYKQVVSAVGGTGSYTYRLGSGSLPVGVSLTSAGAITGTPTGLGTYTFSIVATDSAGGTAAHTYTITINSLPTISTTSLSNWDKSLVGYNHMIEAAGGTGALKYTLKSGTGLPAGLTLNSSTGAITGTPNSTGTYHFSVVATDSIGGSASQAYTVVINSAPQLTTSSLSNWDTNLAGYSQSILTSGGTGTLTYSLKSGSSLPAGLTLNGNTGTIAGAPTNAGTYTFSIVVTDSLGDSATKSFPITISLPTFVTTSLPSGRTGSNYNQEVQARGGSGNFTYSLETGYSLPPGLTMNSAGAITGRPTSKGTTSFYVVATDSEGVTAAEEFTVTIS